MKEETKKMLWLLWIIAGALPGVVIWLFLVKIGIAGEFAGILIGLGAIMLYRWSGAELKNGRMIVGTAILVVIALVVNHLGYSMDIYNSFAENWYGAAGEEFTFLDSIKTVYEYFLVQNVEGMRSFYIEAGIQGTLCTLLFWIALFIYYKKYDEIENEEKTGKK